MKLEVATWIAFCLCVTGTESLVKSQHSWTGGANSRLEKFQPGKKCTAPLAMVVFTSFIHNCSHYRIHGRSHSWARSIMLFYMCGIILILSVKEAVDSLRLHGGVSVARKDGGRTLYWSQGKTLRDTADNLQTKYSPMFFYLCISLFVLEKC